MQNVAASFTINPRHSIYTDFSITEEQAIDTEFQIKADLRVVGEGVINAVTTGNLVTITSSTFIFEQGLSSDTWVIVHNLNKQPSVFAVDSAGKVQLPDEIIYDSENQITVKFLAAFAGKAFLN